MRSPATREALSRERILRTALAIVDREGLAEISMRRVGEELSVEAMSLYNHVASKAAILDGILETVLAELPASKPCGSWQGDLRERSCALRAVLRNHPHALPLFATRPAVTLVSLTHIETALEILRSAGFAADDALSALQALLGFVVGHSIAAYTPAKEDEVSRPAYEQLSEQNFPRVREAARLLRDHDVEREFELGLDAMLRGLATSPARTRRVPGAMTKAR